MPFLLCREKLFRKAEAFCLRMDQLRRTSVAAAPGTVSDDTRVWQNVTPRSEQVSFCRIWVDFRDAAFELARQNREKEQAFFAQKSSFVQCFMGDFYFLRQSGLEILQPGRKNPSPEKEIPGSEKKIPSPEIFSPAPFFSDGGLEALFPAIWNFFTDKSPVSICRYKSRPAYVP